MKKILLTLLVIACPKAFAFGGYGHELICQMAFNALPQDQQQTLNTIVQALPNKEKQLLVKGHKPLTFAKACSWPDKIKRFSKYDKYKPWHYLNTARDDQEITTLDCKGNCVAKGIIYHQQQFVQAKSGLKKAQALSFLGHWIADLHQPLHVSYASDLGGNRTKITYDKTLSKAKCTNLHWYWDECLVMYKNLSVEKYANVLSQDLRFDLTTPWSPELVWHWADESYHLVKSESVSYCQDKDGQCLPYKEKLVIDQAYIDQHLPIAEQQIKRAALRLANILAQSL